jgi:hypothetical protein
MLYRVYAPARPAFAAERLAASACFHPCPKAALAKLLYLALTMVFQNISPVNYFSVFPFFFVHKIESGIIPVFYDISTPK